MTTTTPRRVERKDIPAWEPSWWDRGTPLRHLVFSYYLWSRHIFYDIIGRKPRKGKK